MLVLPGLLVAFGVCLVVAAFRAQHARLADAMSALDSVPDADITASHDPHGGPRLGTWWVRSRRVVASAAVERQLRLKGRTLAEHYQRKVIGLVFGFMLPLIVGIVWWFVTGQTPLIPLALALSLGVIGFLIPDLGLRAASREASEDATEALLTYFDLVTLERLANQSGTQALHAAARLSDVPVFVAIRGSLERAHLEQRAPYGDLKALGAELELPALADLADVMRLDESGASLSGALRARVKELRDAHLTAMKIAAADVSERMTIWMVIPTIVFGLFFLVPPLLTIIASS
ncbi:MAG: hypothetical protein QM708_08185 [Propioniciclava sp.]|uniref:hypothetical protein n=1 Tax=Propioniciclava sp. TaxID=2038686 RepID=UPI0039E2E3E2